MTAAFILLCIACLLWLLAAINWPQSPVSLGWLGMLFYGISLLIR